MARASLRVNYACARLCVSVSMYVRGYVVLLEMKADDN